MSRIVVNKTNFKVELHYTKQVKNFKYLGVNINKKNNMHNEIQIRISAMNRVCFSMTKMLNS